MLSSAKNVTFVSAGCTQRFLILILGNAFLMVQFFLQCFECIFSMHIDYALFRFFL